MFYINIFCNKNIGVFLQPDPLSQQEKEQKKKNLGKFFFLF